MSAFRLIALAALVLSSVAGAQPFKRTPMSNGQLCIYWQTRHYTYHVDQAGDPALSFGDVHLAIEGAAQTWQTLAQTCSEFTLTEGAPISGDDTWVGYTQDGGTNQNIITFRTTNCADIPDTDPCWANDTCANTDKCWDHDDSVIALTTVTYQQCAHGVTTCANAGMILDADIEVNAAPQTGGAPAYTFTTVSSPPCQVGNTGTSCVATDVQNTLTHEMGHVMGLAHVDGGNSTMFAVAQIGETSKRIIDDGTAQGFCGVYPAQQASTAACDISGQVEEAVTAASQGSFTGCSAGGVTSLWTILGVLAVLGFIRGHRLLRSR